MTASDGSLESLKQKILTSEGSDVEYITIKMDRQVSLPSELSFLKNEDQIPKHKFKRMEAMEKTKKEKT